MIKEEIIYAGIPLWLLVEYLEDLGGKAISENQVDGDGWTATIIKHALLHPNGGRWSNLLRGEISLRPYGLAVSYTRIWPGS